MTGIIDCDVHEDLKSIESLRPYLRPEFEMFFHHKSPLESALHIHYSRVHSRAGKPDKAVADSASGTVGNLRDHLNGSGISYGILTGAMNLHVGGMAHEQYAVALASAYNEAGGGGTVKRASFEGFCHSNAPTPAIGSC